MNQKVLTEIMRRVAASLPQKVREENVEKSKRQITLATDVFLAVELATFPLIINLEFEKRDEALVQALGQFTAKDLEDAMVGIKYFASQAQNLELMLKTFIRERAHG